MRCRAPHIHYSDMQQENCCSEKRRLLDEIAAADDLVTSNYLAVGKIRLAEDESRLPRAIQRIAEAHRHAAMLLEKFQDHIQWHRCQAVHESSIFQNRGYRA